MYKIAVVGDYDSIYGFATLGLDTFPVTSRKEAEEKLEHLAASKYGIIYITELPDTNYFRKQVIRSDEQRYD